ncbi:unnamed protein product [Rhizoctonia solani]|uniref:Uncharacterized protein n=1 Tax=Rhizoctonia solani TaxID=456999 RepID=A0A8H2XZM8_9AGAM|nr:unnamed protein product [Rhizoctonia solani]
MPATKGNTSNTLQKCDPRCKRHAGAKVNPRVYKECKRRLDLEEEDALEAASRAQNINFPSGLAGITHSPPVLMDSATGSVLAPAPNRDPTGSGLITDNPWDDTTLPILGEPSEFDLTMDEAAAHWDNIDDRNAYILAGARSPTLTDAYDNVDGTSPFDSPRLFDSSPSVWGASIEDDSELFPPSDFELEPYEPNASNAPMEEAQDEQNPWRDIPKDTHKLPDGLRIMQEWIAYQSSHGQLTVSAAESLLKTLNYCLENDMLYTDGPDSNLNTTRLPLTLDTLRQQAGLAATGLSTHAMCPKTSCQTLRDTATMDSKQAYQCTSCGTSITRPVTVRRRHQKPSVRHIPVLKYTSCDVQQQLEEILGRDEIQKAMAAHHKYLHRPDRPSDLLEDIQHGKTWLEFKRNGELFFSSDSDIPSKNIGFILMLDWFKPNAMQRETQSACVISMCIANLPPELRGRPENKILVGVIPGPHESTVDTIHNFLEPT